MLGKLLRCKVTGFEGIATSRVEYLNGCIQYCLKPKSTDGSYPDGHYIDVEQIEVVDEGITRIFHQTGGNMNDTPGSNYNG